MIYKITRYLMLITAVLVLSVYLPKIYWKLFDENVRVPLILYSPITEKFLLFDSFGENKFTDENGTAYSRSEFEALEPIFYYRQLINDQKMPDSVRGHKIDISEIKLNNFRIRITPDNIKIPTIPLLPMFESQSGRTNLAMPEDNFRITDSRMEFIDCYSNTIDEEKSDFFTEALKKAGFVFPAKAIYGNPTTRKPFDEGYFIVDNADQVFHVKMVKGMPFCKNINVPKGFKVKSMNIAESLLREFYGLIIDENDQLYLISYDNYKLVNIYNKGYNSKTTTMVFRGDLFFRSLQLVNSDSVVVFMYDKNYKVIDRYSQPLKNVKIAPVGVFANIIFPFVVNTSDDSTYYVDLFFSFGSLLALIINIIFLIIAIIIYKIKGYSLIKNIPDFVLVGLTGIFGLLALLIFIPFDKTK